MILSINKPRFSESYTLCPLQKYFIKIQLFSIFEYVWQKELLSKIVYEFTVPKDNT